MEEEERNKKLKAGKEKLVAFQKKRKAKRRKHHSTTHEDGVNPLSGSDFNSSTDFSSSSDVASLDDSDSQPQSEDETTSKQEAKNYLRMRTKLTQAETRIEELEESLMGKQLALDRVIKENTDFKAKLENSKIEQFEAAISERDQLIQQLSTQLHGASEYATYIHQLSQQVQILQTHLHNADKVLQTQTEKQTITSKALEEATREVTTLQQKMTDKDQIVIQLTDKLNMISSEYGNIRSAYETTKAKERETSQVVQKLMMDAEEMRKQKNDISNGHLNKYPDIPEGYISPEELQRQLDVLRTELDEIHGLQIAAMKDEVLKQQENSKAVLESDLVKVNKELEQMNEQVDGYKQQIAQYEGHFAQWNDLLSECNFYKSQNDELKNRINTHHDAVVTLNAEIEKLNTENTTLRGQVLSLSQDIDAQNDEIQDGFAEKSSYEERVKALENDLLKVNAENDTYKNKTKSLEDMIASLRSDLEKSENKSSPETIHPSDVYSHSEPPSQVQKLQPHCIQEDFVVESVATVASAPTNYVQLEMEDNSISPECVQTVESSHAASHLSSDTEAVVSSRDRDVLDISPEHDETLQDSTMKFDDIVTDMVKREVLDELLMSLPICESSTIDQSLHADMPACVSIDQSLNSDLSTRVNISGIDDSEATLTNESKDKSVLLNNLVYQNENLAHQNQQYKSELDKVKVDLQHVTEEKSRLQLHVDKLSSDVINLQEEQGQLDLDRFNHVCQENDNYKAEIENLQQNTASLAANIHSSQQAMEGLQNENSNLNSELEKSLQEMVQLIVSNQNLEKEMSNLREQLEERSAESVATEVLSNDCKDNIGAQTLPKSDTEIDAESDLLSNSVQMHEQEVDPVRESMEMKTDFSTALKPEVTEPMEDMDLLREINCSLRTENEALLKHVCDLEEKLMVKNITNMDSDKDLFDNMADPSLFARNFDTMSPGSLDSVEVLQGRLSEDSLQEFGPFDKQSSPLPKEVMESVTIPLTSMMQNMSGRISPDSIDGVQMNNNAVRNISFDSLDDEDRAQDEERRLQAEDMVRISSSCMQNISNRSSYNGDNAFAYDNLNIHGEDGINVCDFKGEMERGVPIETSAVGDDSLTCSINTDEKMPRLCDDQMSRSCYEQNTLSNNDSVKEKLQVLSEQEVTKHGKGVSSSSEKRDEEPVEQVNIHGRSSMDECKQTSPLSTESSLTDEIRKQESAKTAKEAESASSATMMKDAANAGKKDKESAKLRAKVKLAQKENSSLKESLSSVEEKNVELCSEINSCKEQLETVALENDRLAEEKLQLQSQVDRLSHKWDEMEKSQLIDADSMKDKMMDLEKEMESLICHRNELTNKNSSLQCEVDKFSEQISDLQQCIALLGAEKTNMETENVDISASLEKLQQDNDDLTMKYGNLQTDLHQKTEEYSALKEQIETIQKKNSELTQEKSDLLSQIEALDNELEQINRTVELVTSEKVDLESKVEVAGNTNAELLERAVGHQTELTSLKEEFDKTKEEKKQLESRLETLTEEVQSRAETVNSLENILTEKQEIVNNLQRDCENLEKDLQEKEEKVHDLESMISEMENDKESTCAGLQDKVTSLLAENEGKTTSLDTLTEDMQGLKSELSDRQQEIEKSEKEIEMLKREVCNYQDNIKSQEEEITSKNSTLENLQSQNELQLAELDSLKSENVSLQEFRDSYNHSKMGSSDLEVKLQEISFERETLRKELVDKNHLFSTASEENEILKQEIDTKDQALAEQSHQLNSLQSELSDCSANLDTMSIKTGELQQALLEKDENIESLGDELQSIKLSYAEKDANITQLVKECEILKEKLNETEISYKSLGQEFDEYKQEVTSQENEVMIRLKEKDEAKEKLLNSLGETQNKLTDTECEKESLQRRILELQNEVTITVSNLDESKRHLDNAKDVLNQQEVKMDDQAKLITEKDMEISELRETASDTRSKLESEVETMKLSLNEKDSLVEHLQTSLMEMEAKIYEHDNSQSAYEKEVNRLTEYVSELEESLHEASDKAESLETDKNELLHKNTELETQIHDNENELSLQSQKTMETEKELGEIKIQIQSLERDKNELLNKNTELETQIHDIENDLSLQNQKTMETEKELGEIKTELDCEKATSETQKQCNQELMAELGELKHSSEERDQRINELDQQVTEQRNRNHKIEQENNGLICRMTELEHALSEINGELEKYKSLVSNNEHQIKVLEEENGYLKSNVSQGNMTECRQISNSSMSELKSSENDLLESESHAFDDDTECESSSQGVEVSESEKENSAQGSLILELQEDVKSKEKEIKELKVQLIDEEKVRKELEYYEKLSQEQVSALEDQTRENQKLKNLLVDVQKDFSEMTLQRQLDKEEFENEKAALDKEVMINCDRLAQIRHEKDQQQESFKEEKLAILEKYDKLVKSGTEEISKYQQALEAERQEHGREVLGHQETEANLQTNINELKLVIENHLSEIESLKQTQESLISENEEKQKNLEIMEIRFNAAKEKFVEKLDKTLEELGQSHQNEAKLHSDMKEIESKFGDQLSNFEDGNEYLKVKTEQLQEEIKLKENEKVLLNEKLQETEAVSQQHMWEANGQIIKLEEEVKDLQFELDKETTSKREMRDALENSILKLIDENNGLKNNLSTLSAEVKTEKEECDKTYKEIQTLINDRENLKDQLKSLTESFKLLTEESMRSNESVNDSINNLQETVVAKEEQMNSLQRVLESDREEFFQEKELMSRKNDALTAEIEKIRQDKLQLEQENSNIVKEIETLRHQLELEQSDLSPEQGCDNSPTDLHTSKQVKDLLSEKGNLEDTIKELQKQLSSEIQNTHLLKSQLDEMKQSNVAENSVEQVNKEFSHKLKDLENENENISQQCEKLKVENQKLEDENEKLLNAQESMVEDLCDMQQKYESVQSLMEDTKKECNKEIEELQSHLRKVNIDMTSLKSSIQVLESDLSVAEVQTDHHSSRQDHSLEDIQEAISEDTLVQREELGQDTASVLSHSEDEKFRKELRNQQLLCRSQTDFGESNSVLNEGGFEHNNSVSHNSLPTEMEVVQQESHDSEDAIKPITAGVVSCDLAASAGHLVTNSSEADDRTSPNQSFEGNQNHGLDPCNDVANQQENPESSNQDNAAEIEEIRNNIEYQLEEKYALKFRDREAELHLKFENDFKAYKKDMDTYMRHKEEVIKAEKDQTFIKNMQKVKKDYERRLRKELDKQFQQMLKEGAGGGGRKAEEGVDIGGRKAEEGVDGGGRKAEEGVGAREAETGGPDTKTGERTSSSLTENMDTSQTKETHPLQQPPRQLENLQQELRFIQAESENTENEASFTPEGDSMDNGPRSRYSYRSQSLILDWELTTDSFDQGRGTDNLKFVEHFDKHCDRPQCQLIRRNYQKLYEAIILDQESSVDFSDNEEMDNESGFRPEGEFCLDTSASTVSETVSISNEMFEPEDDGERFVSEEFMPNMNDSGSFQFSDVGDFTPENTFQADAVAKSNVEPSNVGFEPEKGFETTDCVFEQENRFENEEEVFEIVDTDEPDYMDEAVQNKTSNKKLQRQSGFQPENDSDMHEYFRSESEPVLHSNRKLAEGQSSSADNIDVKFLSLGNSQSKKVKDHPGEKSGFFKPFIDFQLDGKPQQFSSRPRDSFQTEEEYESSGMEAGEGFKPEQCTEASEVNSPVTELESAFVKEALRKAANTPAFISQQPVFFSTSRESQPNTNPAENLFVAEDNDETNPQGDFHVEIVPQNSEHNDSTTETKKETADTQMKSIDNVNLQEYVEKLKSDNKRLKEKCRDMVKLFSAEKQKLKKKHQQVCTKLENEILSRKHFEQEVSELNEDIVPVDSRENMKSIENKMKEREQVIKDLKEEMRQLKEKLDLQPEYHALETQIKDLQNQLDEKEQSLSSQKLKYEEINQFFLERIHEVKDSVDKEISAYERNKIQERQLTVTTSEPTSDRDDKFDLNNQVDSLEAHVKELIAERYELYSRCQALENFEAEKDLLLTRCKEMENLEAERNSLLSQCKELESLRKERDILYQKLEDLQNPTMSGTEEYDSSGTNLNSLESKCRELEELVKLKDKFIMTSKVEMDKELEQYEQQILMLSSENSELKAKCKPFESSDRDDLENEIRSLEHSLRNLTSSSLLLEEKCNNMEELMASKEDAICKLQSHIRTLEDHVCDLTSNKQELHLRCSEYQSEINKFTNSVKHSVDPDKQKEHLAKISQLEKMITEKDLYITKLEDDLDQIDQPSEQNDFRKVKERYEKTLREQDSYIKKLEEHFLRQKFEDLPMPKGENVLLPETPEESLDLNSSPEISDAMQAAVSEQHQMGIAVENKNSSSDSENKTLDRELKLNLSASSVGSSPRPRGSRGPSLERQIIASVLHSRSPASSIAGSLDGIEKVRSEEDGHMALELVDEISLLRKDLRETKAIYTQENALLRDALDNQTKKPKRSSSVSLNTEGQHSMEVMQLREKVGVLQETNKMLQMENDRWLRKIQDQEMIVLELREMLGRESLGVGEVEKVFGKQISLLQRQRDDLVEKLHDLEAKNDRLSKRIGDKNILEESLRREKELLHSKLSEKDDIERELTEKKLELERQKRSQQQLEEIFYHKNLTEKELMRQKRLLEEELSEIECKLCEKEELLEIQKNQLLREIKQKDSSTPRYLSGSFSVSFSGDDTLTGHTTLHEGLDSSASSEAGDVNKKSQREIGRLEVQLQQVEREYAEAIQKLKDRMKTESSDTARHQSMVASMKTEQFHKVPQ